LIIGAVKVFVNVFRLRPPSKEKGFESIGLWAKTAVDNARAPTKNVIFFILIIVCGLCKDKGDNH
jgi:hypothetical protein